MWSSVFGMRLRHSSAGGRLQSEAGIGSAKRHSTTARAKRSEMRIYKLVRWSGALGCLCHGIQRTMEPHLAGLQLPSIRTLHPYLPALGPGPSTSTSTYEPAQMSTQSQGAGAYPPSSHAGSDGDERGVTGENEPPKKKRRRQALSCTGASLKPVLLNHGDIQLMSGC
jgi:hypothetical protein